MKQYVQIALDSLSANDFSGNISEMILRVTCLTEKYRLEGYKNLLFKEEREQGEFNYEDQPVSFILYGEREETDKECEKRLAKEEKAVERKKANELKAKENKNKAAKAKRQRDYEKFLKLKQRYDFDAASKKDGK